MTSSPSISPLFQQVQRWATGGGQRPDAEALVDALLAAEKSDRRRPNWTDSDLEGTWRLSFITGTKASQQRAGVVLGPGRYVPRWVSVTITYTSDLPKDVPADIPANTFGWAYNRVAVAEAAMTVSGPTRLWPHGLLAFDFTRMAVGLGPWSGIQIPIRGGGDREAKFYQRAVRDQAFFHYF
ncbi:MAG: hypothetical protein AAF289_02735, partial [Cyanobacteria bacterium P01_A01_bin.135]